MSLHAIVMPPRGTQENLKEAIKAGAFDFLQKPISEEQIKTLISKAAR